MPTPRRLLATVPCSLLALAGCGGDDGEPAATTVFMPTTVGATDTADSDDDDDDDSATESMDTGDPSTDSASDSTTDPDTGDATDDGTTGAPIGGPAGSCGMGGVKNEIVQIELGSPERWYLVGAPDTDEPLPLVLAFHGDEGDPFNSTRYIWGSWWEDNAPPFIVVMTKCPGCTSWYMGDTNANADYVWEVLADVASEHNVDVSRIYAIGFSGGSEFLALHGFEFQDVFAGIQWSCGGNAYGPYTQATRPDCKVHGRIVIAADDFLWDGAQMLLQRLQTEGHEHEFVEAQCSGHCCSTPDENAGAWAWFQQQTKCNAEVPGMCGELTDLPPAPFGVEPGIASAMPPASGSRVVVAAPRPAADFDAAVADFDRVMAEPVATDRQAQLRAAMAAYDRMLAAAHHHGAPAKAAMVARYPRLRAQMAELAAP